MPSSRARRTRVLLETVQREELAQQPIVAIKIGGSLMTSPHLIERIEWLLAQRPETRPLFICGGGGTADLVRRWQKMHGLSDERAHWLALAAMSFNETLLRSALPHSCRVGNIDEIDRAWTDDRRPILRASRFLEEMNDGLREPLSESWDVTSDSIAAWCAHVIGVDELILAKSVDVPSDATLEFAKENDAIDRYFDPNLCPEEVTWTNLRSPEPTLVTWSPI